MTSPTVRERFERWFKRHHPDREEMLRLEDGMDWWPAHECYAYLRVDEAWRTYKAGYKAGRDLGRGRRG